MCTCLNYFNSQMSMGRLWKKVMISRVGVNNSINAINLRCTYRNKLAVKTVDMNAHEVRFRTLIFFINVRCFIPCVVFSQ